MVGATIARAVPAAERWAVGRPEFMLQRTRTTVVGAVVVTVAVAVAQYATWRAVARRSLPGQLPRMLRYQLLNAERRMAPYNVWPRDVHIVLANPLLENLATETAAFHKAYAPAKVRVSSERPHAPTGSWSIGGAAAVMLSPMKKSGTIPSSLASPFR
jgi:hypothetical protein